MINAKLRIFKLEEIEPQKFPERTGIVSKDYNVEDFKEAIEEGFKHATRIIPSYLLKDYNIPWTEVNHGITKHENKNIHTAVTSYTGTKPDGLQVTFVLTLVGKEIL